MEPGCERERFETSLFIDWFDNDIPRIENGSMIRIGGNVLILQYIMSLYSLFRVSDWLLRRFFASYQFLFPSLSKIIFYSLQNSIIISNLSFLLVKSAPPQLFHIKSLRFRNPCSTRSQASRLHEWSFRQEAAKSSHHARTAQAGQRELKIRYGIKWSRSEMGEVRRRTCAVRKRWAPSCHCHPNPLAMFADIPLPGLVFDMAHRSLGC